MNEPTIISSIHIHNAANITPSLGSFYGDGTISLRFPTGIAEGVYLNDTPARLLTLLQECERLVIVADQQGPPSDDDEMTEEEYRAFASESVPTIDPEDTDTLRQLREDMGG